MATVDTTLSQHGEQRPGAGASGPWLFLVLRAERPLEPPARLSLRAVYEVEMGRVDARHLEHATHPGSTRVLQMGLDDRWLPGLHDTLERLATVARSPLSVLVTGPS